MAHRPPKPAFMPNGPFVMKQNQDGLLQMSRPQQRSNTKSQTPHYAPTANAAHSPHQHYAAPSQLPAGAGGGPPFPRDSNFATARAHHPVQSGHYVHPYYSPDSSNGQSITENAQYGAVNQTNTSCTPSAANTIPSDPVPSETAQTSLELMQRAQHEQRVAFEGSRRHHKQKHLPFIPKKTRRGQRRHRDQHEFAEGVTMPPSVSSYIPVKPAAQLEQSAIALGAAQARRDSTITPAASQHPLSAAAPPFIPRELQPAGTNYLDCPESYYREYMLPCKHNLQADSIAPAARPSDDSVKPAPDGTKNHSIPPPDALSGKEIISQDSKEEIEDMENVLKFMQDDEDCEAASAAVSAAVAVLCADKGDFEVRAWDEQALRKWEEVREMLRVERESQSAGNSERTGDDVSARQASVGKGEDVEIAA